MPFRLESSVSDSSIRTSAVKNCTRQFIFLPPPKKNKYSEYMYTYITSASLGCEEICSLWHACEPWCAKREQPLNDRTDLFPTSFHLFVSRENDPKMENPHCSRKPEALYNHTLVILVCFIPNARKQNIF